MTITEAARFWAKVRINPEGCWEWIACRDRNGYGFFFMDGKNLKAHRIAYEEKVGPIPSGYFVLHGCDNPRCVRPDHLTVGTASDNSRDMASKGRSVRGSRNPQAKLTEEDVRAIRSKRNAGQSLPSIGKEFSVTHQAILNIVMGRTWAWLDAA